MKEHHLVRAPSMTDADRSDPASSFVSAWVAGLPVPEHARALDLATGRGRHAAVAARAGYQTFIVDRALDVLCDTTARLERQGFAVKAWCADLEVTPLPRNWFDLVIVTRYLQRSLCQAITESLRPGGVLIYETFTERQRRHGRGPTSPEFLLASGELPKRFRDLEMMFYEEVDEPEAVARLVARASTRRS